MVWRVISIVIMSVGIGALLFAQLFANLTALSSGFEERRMTALWIGLVVLAVGVTLSLLTSRPKRIHPGGGSSVLRLVVTLFASVLIGWLAFGAVVYMMQDSLVFSPRGLSASRLERIAREYPRAEDIEIVAADGAILRGWLLPPMSGINGAGTSGDGPSNGEGLPPADPFAAPNPLMIVFAGQGGEVSGYFDLAERVPELAWAFVNYRGYGASDGTPSDKALFEDATALFDNLAMRPDIDADNVFVLGGSLGTGVATYLASQRPVAGIILFSPYDRIGGGVTQDLLPFVPTKMLFRNRFDAVAYAPDIDVPALAVIGNLDQVIRPERSRNLLTDWGGESQLLILEDGDHFNIYEDDGAWLAVRDFVRRLLK